MRDSLILNLFRQAENSQAADVTKEDLSRYTKASMHSNPKSPRSAHFYPVVVLSR